MGNRIGKSNFYGTNTNSTWYINDASGNNMATYNRYNDQGLYIDEFNIYGSSSLGTFKPPWPYPVTSQSPSSANSTYFAYPSGYKQYELTNHLGNVLTTISDQKTPVNDDSDPETDYFTAIVKTQQDYYPGGMMMPARMYSLGGVYRYGFNGMEKDNEIKGTGNSLDFGARIYDPRLGRFLSVDSLFKDFAWNSPYSFAENDVISCIDLDGLKKFKIIEVSYSNENGSEMSFMILTCWDVSTAFEVIDEEGNSLAHFKYCYLDKIIRDWKPIKGPSPIYETNAEKNIGIKVIDYGIGEYLEQQKMDGEFGTGLSNFSIKDANPIPLSGKPIAGEILRKGASIEILRGSILSNLSSYEPSDPYDIIKVWFPTELRSEFETAMKSFGFTKPIEYQSAPREADSSMEVIFFSTDCE